jgi:hypothetical protein
MAEETMLRSVKEIEGFKIKVIDNEIKNSPEYYPATPVERSYENTIHEYYDKRKYWEK